MKENRLRESGAIEPSLVCFHTRISHRFDNTKFSTRRCFRKFGGIESLLLVLYLNNSIDTIDIS